MVKTYKRVINFNVFVNFKLSQLRKSFVIFRQTLS